MARILRLRALLDFLQRRLPGGPKPGQRTRGIRFDETVETAYYWIAEPIMAGVMNVASWLWTARRRIFRLLVWNTGVLTVAIVAIWAALLITPPHSETVGRTASSSGTTFSVSATRPDGALSGPGEFDLLDHSGNVREIIPTKQLFSGLIRPRVETNRINLGTDQLSTPAARRQLGQTFGHRLVSGEIWYFLQEVSIAVGIAWALLWLAFRFVPFFGYRKWRLARMIVLGMALVAVVNIGSIAATAYQAVQTLRQVTSLTDLVGSSPVTVLPGRIGPKQPKVQIVVLGDSTAAAIGNPPVNQPSALDHTCGRSRDSYAAQLAGATGETVLNLACRNATLPSGILGEQALNRGKVIVPPQLGIAKQATQATTVIVSIGANDVQWSQMVTVCAISSACNDTATETMFEGNLVTFTQELDQLLQQLANLPQHPDVVLNEYYNPFVGDLGCMASTGLTAKKVAVLKDRLDRLNNVLVQGADVYGFKAVLPQFAHGICDVQPDVQGPGANAPMHPTASGELVIALEDLVAMNAPRRIAEAQPLPTK